MDENAWFSKYWFILTGTTKTTTVFVLNNSKIWFLVSEYQQYQEATIEEDEEFDHDEDADE